MELSNETYFSEDADREYLSHTQVRSFMTCQSAWKAQYVDGDHKPEPSAEMLVGSYVHTAVLQEELLEDWKEKHGEQICNQDGSLSAKFKVADYMVAAIKTQAILADYLSGMREKVYTGVIHGMKFKGLLDCVNHEEPRIVDLKTTGDLREQSWRKVDWLPEGKAMFYDYYWLQLAIYRELYYQAEGKYPAVYVVGVSKQSPPDTNLYKMAAVGRFNEELKAMKGWLQLLKRVAMGEVAPTRCSKCEWCRISNRISEPLLITGK